MFFVEKVNIFCIFFLRGIVIKMGRVKTRGADDVFSSAKRSQIKVKGQPSNCNAYPPNDGYAENGRGKGQSVLTHRAEKPEFLGYANPGTLPVG
jgi:hypothetical protein